MHDVFSGAATLPVLHRVTETVGWPDSLSEVAERLTGLWPELMVLDCERPPLRVVAVGALAAGTAVARGPGRRRSPLRVLESAAAQLRFTTEVSEVERSFFGFVSYGAANDIEVLPDRGERALPDYVFFLPRVLVFAEPAGLRLVGRGSTRASAAHALAQVFGRLFSPGRRGGRPVSHADSASVRLTLDRPGYCAAVRVAKEAICDGEVFQLVLSVGCRLGDGRLRPVDLYTRLRRGNPSPLLFSYQGPGFGAAGASPEPFLSVHAGRCMLRPLAGTRPRGADPFADAMAEADLRSSAKELAEHRMLVDLARNDLGRVSKPGTVRVTELMNVERYSHVMHLASQVVGELADGCGPADVVHASFPAGTMTGTPKVRAMELIHQLEPTQRWLYSGAVGLLSATDALFYLVIRSAVFHNGAVSFQAGAGIVHDSVPDQEYDECRAKLAAIAAAIGVTV